MATGRASAADLAHALGGTDFPAKRDDLMKIAKKNGASEDIIETVGNFPEDVEFRSMADVQHEFSRLR